MSKLTAEVLVDGKPQVIMDGYDFHCRDGLIPDVWRNLHQLHSQGLSLSAYREDPPLRLSAGGYRGESIIDWNGIMGINAGFSPLASPFLLRFYIGRVRNGYKYQRLEDALRQASAEGVPLEENMATAWQLDKNSIGLGLSYILPTVNGWNYGALTPNDYVRIFPPKQFI